MTENQEGMLRLESLTILRNRASPLVTDLSLSIGAGEILAVVGQSGIGKSSILNVVAGFVRQKGRRIRSPWLWFEEKDDLEYTGAVRVGGVPIDGTPPEGRSAIGMVMQGGVVYEHLSVLQNITFPLRAAGNRDRRSLREAALKLLDETELFDDLSVEKREARLNAKAGTLSGGERQRVALARAFAKGPSVFLLDEAFANLDPVLRAELFERFTRLIVGQSRCAMVVTHDLSDLGKAQRILLLGHSGDRPGYCSYRRRNDNSLEVEEDRGGESDYWRAWDERIRAASSR
jgi:ABC-type nitrate/sulfonate/bicarbonate transport system ATPase subunit